MARPFVRHVVTLALLAALAACGGGGGDTFSSSSSGGGSNESPATALRGKVALASPVTGARVSARCQGGVVPAAVSTDAAGAYALELGTAVPPCLVQASGGQVNGQANTQVLHGLAAQAGPVQVTALSELALAWAWGAAPASRYAAFAAPADAPDAAQQAAARSWVAAQLSGLGLAAPSGDLFTGAFVSGDATAQLLTAFDTLITDKGHTLGVVVDNAAGHADLAVMVNGDRAIAVEFAGVAGDTPVRCGGAPITGLGSLGSTARLMDFRFYLSEVELLRADGSAVRLRLPANGDWQHTAANGDAVTLIDLEDGSADCAIEGTAGTNAWLRGSVPAGRYVGLRMTMGVPHSLNHSDTASAPAPLDLVAMGWSWQAGRKFAKIEFTEPSAGLWPSDSFYIHLGSTGCSGNAGLGTVTCSRPNRVTVQLDTFDVDTQKILVDVRAMMDGTNATINQGGAQGCMSAATDRDCLSLFALLGIEWKADGSGSGLPLPGGAAPALFRGVAR
jgi:uncharacterized repeat protein (TIGR04052 family)